VDEGTDVFPDILAELVDKVLPDLPGVVWDGRLEFEGKLVNIAGLLLEDVEHVRDERDTWVFTDKLRAAWVAAADDGASWARLEDWFGWDDFHWWLYWL
jgi:hypothetical protein